MKNQDWEIPPNLQPDPDDYSFDLERSLRAIVNLKTYVPPDAFTAETLGTERAGSAGAEVRLRLMRDKTPVAVTVRSKDRSSFLKSPKLH